MELAWVDGGSCQQDSWEPRVVFTGFIDLAICNENVGAAEILR